MTVLEEMRQGLEDVWGDLVGVVSQAHIATNIDDSQVSRAGRKHLRGAVTRKRAASNEAARVLPLGELRQERTCSLSGFAIVEMMLKIRARRRQRLDFGAAGGSIL